MSDEQEVKPAEEVKAAPEAAGTAPVVEAPVSGEEKPVEPVVETKAEKSFSQSEVEAIIGKRLARERRSWEREQTRQPQAPAEAKPVEPAAKPNPENFKTTEEYIEAVSEWKADQRIEVKLTERENASRELRERQAMESAQAAYAKREEASKIAHDDYEEKVYNRQLPITNAMSHAIMYSEQGSELAYYLGQNPQEAARISQLHPILQAKELGKLEAKLPSITTQAKTTTSAPEPIKPLGGGKTSTVVTDIFDPKAAKTLSTDEWMKQREKQLRAKWEGQGRR